MPKDKVIESKTLDYETFCFFFPVFIFLGFFCLFLKGGSYSQNYGGGQVSSALLHQLHSTSYKL